MKIAILGYGKMGKEIEKVSLEKGHEITLKVDKNFIGKINSDIDVAINFCTPETAFENISMALNNRIPVVSGTTGWLSNYSKVVELSKKKQTSFLYSANFSLGVNLFFELNKKLTKIMNNHDDYNLTIKETHHQMKKDNPSGTALKLVEDIIQNGNHTNWSKTKKNNSIYVESIRKNLIPGTHVVKYSSEIDEIKIIHKAKNRKGFATGAVIAAEWIQDKKGVFGMNDVINDIKMK